LFLLLIEPEEVTPGAPGAVETTGDGANDEAVSDPNSFKTYSILVKVYQ